MSGGPFASGPRAGRGALVASLAAALGLLAAGCGSTDFPNDPRPPAPIDVSAKIDSKRVVVSPNKFGAGLVNFTVANLSRDPVRFQVEGPTKGRTATIEPGAPANLKMVLEKGLYLASTGDNGSTMSEQLHVGPPRNTSQNDLLLP
jgi:hypothetical protein